MPARGMELNPLFFIHSRMDCPDRIYAQATGIPKDEMEEESFVAALSRAPEDVNPHLDEVVYLKYLEDVVATIKSDPLDPDTADKLFQSTVSLGMYGGVNPMRDYVSIFKDMTSEDDKHLIRIIIGLLLDEVRSFASDFRAIILSRALKKIDNVVEQEEYEALNTKAAMERIASEASAVGSYFEKTQTVGSDARGDILGSFEELRLRSESGNEVAHLDEVISKRQTLLRNLKKTRENILSERGLDAREVAEDMYREVEGAFPWN